MRSEAEASLAIELYADTVRRVCALYLCSDADTEDIFQTVFLRYVLHRAKFESAEHERAWFIRVTRNACCDWYRQLRRRNTVPLEAAAARAAPQASEETREVLEAVLALPAKFRDVVYLHYYEGYAAEEIARLLRRNVNTVYTHLRRARELLRNRLEGGAGDG